MSSYPKPFGSLNKPGTCKSCGLGYLRTHPGQRFCEVCSVWTKKEMAQTNRNITRLVRELEDDLDKTCKVYDCEHYSQSFLWSLIPKK